MGGMIALLGGAASSLGGAAGAGAAGAGAAGAGATAGAAMGGGMAAGAAAEGAGAALGSGIGAGASAIGAGAASEGAGTAMGAAAVGEGLSAASGEGAKGFFSQAWDMAKEDIKDTAEKNFIVRDAEGNIDKGKTAGKTGYTLAKRAILSSGGGEAESAPIPQPEDMSHAAPAETSGVTAPDAEDELNKLRNRINS